MVDAVEKAGVPNMVWYNYRRVPAVTLHQEHGRQPASSARSSTTARSSSRTGRSIPDVPQGGAAHLAARCRCRGLGRHRRPPRPLPRYRDLDQRRHLLADRDDRDLRQGAQARRHRQDAAGRHRRRRRGADPLRQRLARHVRIDPLRPRPQGGLHARDQRREGLARLGPARPQPRQLFDHSRRRRRCAAGPTSSSPTATTPTWASGGCPASSSATSRASPTRSPTSSMG